MESLNSSILDKGLDYHGKPFMYFYTWYLTLDKNLSFNLTFYDLYFSSASEDCLRGNFTIYNDMFSYKASHMDPLIFYCDHHSCSNVYPGAKNIGMRTIIFPRLQHVLNASFSVMDVNITTLQIHKT